MAGTKEIIGLVTKLEVQAIEPVIERLNGLKELLMIVVDDEVEAKIKEEIPHLESHCDNWWNEMSSKYGWNLPSSSDWELDYMNGEVWVG